MFVKVRKPDGSWSAPISAKTDDEAEAEQFQRNVQAQMEAGHGPGGAPMTVAVFAEKWIKARIADGVITGADDGSRIRRFLLPHIGAMRIEEVRPRHIIDWVRKLRRMKALVITGQIKGKRIYKPGDKPIAPRTVRNTVTAVSAMFTDAVVEELISASPVVLRRKDLPKKRDDDPEWRVSAIFTLAELEQIISDQRIPWDRRVLYALFFLTSSRFGEVAAMKWQHYDDKPRPLGRMTVALSYNTKLKTVKETKTQSPRTVPVHAVLAAILAEWKLTGFEQQFGRKPKDSDLIVPSREWRNRSVNHSLKKFHQDLERIDLRSRRQHDARRTFKTIAQNHGVNESRLGWITHGRPSSIDGQYDEPPWRQLCEVVLAMRIQRRDQPVIPLQKRLGAHGATTPPKSDDLSDEET